MSGRQLGPFVAAAMIALLAVRAIPAHAAMTETWSDSFSGKQWTLTEKPGEYVVVLAPGVDPGSRQTVFTQGDVREVRPYSEAHRVAVVAVEPRSGAAPSGAAQAIDLEARPEIQAVAPAFVDQEGFTKYIVPGELVVQFDRDLSDRACRRTVANMGSRVLFDYWTPGFYKIAVPAGSGVFEEVRRWFERDDVLFAEPVYMGYDDALYVPDDPLYPLQWNLDNPGDVWTSGADVQAPEAWDLTTGSPDIVIAVVDTGMDLDHPDLAANLLDRGDDDWDFADSLDASPDDTDHVFLGRHGTAVCGIAAAVQGNGEGISGIAPDCKLMPLRIDVTSGQNANRADAINYAASRRAEFDALILNLSWRMSAGDMSSVMAAVQLADSLDCVIVAASGNLNQGEISYPARYPETIAVGATSPCDERMQPSTCVGTLSWGSNYGPELDVVAPGVLIPTTDLAGSEGYASTDYHGGFFGTSAAAPLVSGICALIYSVDPSLSNDEVRQILHDSAEDLVGLPGEDSAGWDPYMGHGRVNAYLAVLEAAEAVDEYLQNFEAGFEESWSHFPLTPDHVDSWTLTDARNHTPMGLYAWTSGAADTSLTYADSLDAVLVSPPIVLTAEAEMSFWHYMDAHAVDSTASALDGGRLEITSDLGQTWETLHPTVGYTHVWGSPDSAFAAGKEVYSGQIDWTPVHVDLAAYQGRLIQIRFHFASRDSIPEAEVAEGWYIDDIHIHPATPASAADLATRATRLFLSPAFPNPVRHETSVLLQMAHPGDLTLEICDVSGRRVHRQALGRLEAGEHRIDLRPAHWRDGRLSRGVYFYRVVDRESGAQAAQRLTYLPLR